MPLKIVAWALTPEEMDIRRAELAKLPEAIETAREVANAERAKHREQIADMEKRRDELIAIVSSGREPRERLVSERQGAVAGAVEVVDNETGDVVEVRAHEDSGPLFKGTGDKKAARKGEGKAKKGQLEVADNRNPHAGPGHEFSTGEPGKGRGDDGEEYELDAAQADEVRNGRSVKVQGAKGEVEILNLIKPPKKKSKSNGASDAHAEV